MATEFKTGDTSPDITGTVTDANGPVNISTATALKFIAVSGAKVITGAAVNLDIGDVPTRGKWRYVFTATDLNTVGDFEAEIEVTFPGGPPTKITTFPNAKSRNPRFTVTADLG